MTTARNSALTMLLAFALPQAVLAQGDATALIDALRSSTSLGLNIDYDEIVDDPVSGTGIIRGLSLREARSRIEISEIRISGLEKAPNGDIRTIDNLVLDNVDMSPAPGMRLTIHDMRLENTDIAALKALLEARMTPETAAALNQGAILGRGMAFSLDDLSTTVDRLVIDGISAGRLKGMEIERIRINNAAERGEASLERMNMSGISLERLALHLGITEARAGLSTFDAQRYRAAAFAEQPFSLHMRNLRMKGPQGQMLLPEMMLESHREGENDIVADFSLDRLEVIENGEVLSGHPATALMPQGTFRLDMSGTTRTDMRSFFTEGGVKILSDGLATVEVTVSGTALDFFDAKAAGTPSSTLAKLVIDYADEGLVAAAVDEIARNMGVDRQGLAFQTATFARLLFPNGGPARVQNGLRAIEDFVANPQRLVISLTPSEPVPINDLRQQNFALGDMTQLFERLGLELSTGPSP